MNQSWKRSFWTKLIAVCFIGLVVLGNIWLVQRFSLDVPPLWLQTCFVGLTGAIFVFGAALLAEQLMQRIGESDQAQIEREDHEDPSKDHD